MLVSADNETSRRGKVCMRLYLHRGESVCIVSVRFVLCNLKNQCEIINTLATSKLPWSGNESCMIIVVRSQSNLIFIYF